MVVKIWEVMLYGGELCQNKGKELVGGKYEDGLLSRGGTRLRKDIIKLQDMENRVGTL